MASALSELETNRKTDTVSKISLKHVRNAITVRYEEKGQRIWKDFGE